MEAVKAFNAELSSLYEVKPPISKAKMTAITRGAIKAIKFYKHVVQSVEKFILKCKPEYKVPGLYVIDSIVRQSRHQFGTDKDVFAPRFAKNIQQTFVNLFKCPPEDKSKIIRVLNLWQKNQVFAPEVIQPLFDLANPNHPIHKELSASNAVAANNGLSQGNLNIVRGSPALQKSPTKLPQQGAEVNTLAHLGGVSNNPNMLLNADPNVLAHLQQLHRLLIRGGGGDTGKGEGGQSVHFDRKLLDYDYGEDEEEPQNPSPKIAANNVAPHETVTSLLSNPEVLRHLQTLQQSELDLEKLRKLQEMKQQEEEFDKHLAQTVPNLPFAAECEFKPNTSSGFFLPSSSDLSQPPPGYNLSHEEGAAGGSEVEFVESNDNGDVEVITLDHGDSRSPSPRDDRYSSSRRRRSRSRERRRSRRSRSRSYSRSRRHRSRSRTRSKEREREREKEKERKKRGLPPIKKENLSVCSTTLWVGHLSKLVYQEELYNTFGEFGDVVSIDLIPPRGCAFIVMHRRQDAARCLTKLRNHKIQGKAITLAWAPGKGVKGKDLKDYWEGDLGVSYIPWVKIKPDIDLELLEDGGTIDEDTMPIWMKAKVNEMNAKTSGTVTVDKALLSDEMKNALLGTPNLDTTQPPPVPPTVAVSTAAGGGGSGGGGLLQPPPPPLTLPLVNPFQLNNSLLGMNLPPGMMPNVPIGVPPPNLPQAAAAAAAASMMMGLNSPFSQGPPPPNLLQTMQLANEQKEQQQQLMNMTGQPFVMPSMEDNMDVEMEDAAKEEPLPPPMMFGEHHQQGFEELQQQQQRGRRDENGGGRDRGRRGSRSRDRGRDRDGRNQHRNSRDRGGGGGKDRKDGRWGDGNNRRGSGGGGGERDDRRERSEKTVNDRLWEMAEGYSSRDRPRDLTNDVVPPPPPPLLEKPDFIPPHHMNYDDAPMEPHHFHRRGGPPPPGPDGDFEPPPPPHHHMGPLPLPLPLPHPPGGHDGFELGGDFERPPRMQQDDFEPQHHERFGRGRDHRRDGFVDERRMLDDFEGGRGPMRGGPGGGGPGPGPEFFGPRESFGGPPRGGPLMRGPGPGGDGFQGRGPPRGPPGPRMFHPRGPLLRGPRPGPPWMEGGGGGGGGMRNKFPPRFDGPNEFFRGPPGPPGMYDDGPPPHPRQHRRYDDRRNNRHNRPDYDNEKDQRDHHQPPAGRAERNSRWSSRSPPRHQENSDLDGGDGGGKEEGESRMEEESEEKMDGGDGGGGNTTPLHDEPEEPLQQQQQRQEEREEEVVGGAREVEGAGEEPQQQPKEEEVASEQVNTEQ